jgi:hypothetical protein
MGRHHRLLALPLGCLAVLTCLPARAADEIDPSRGQADPKDPVLWYNILLLDLEGKGWKDTKAPFDRLPAKAQGVVRDPVWNLSRHSAGMCVRFVTDATTLRARWTLTSDRLVMPHMPATGVSGLDLYVRSGTDGRWQWLGVGQPSQTANTAQLAAGLPAGKRELLLYLPLYTHIPHLRLNIRRCWSETRSNDSSFI